MNLEDLLKVASSEEDSEIQEIGDRSVRRFVKDFQITYGEIKVPTYVIYYNYIKWVKNLNLTKVGKTEFFRQFKREFDQKRSKSCRYYMLNECFNLSEEAMDRALDYDKKYQR